MQSGIARMLISTDKLDWQAELGHANRAFAATIGGQLYEDISREEARRLRKLQPDRKAILGQIRKSPA
jgi:hypothetical protein